MPMPARQRANDPTEDVPVRRRALATRAAAAIIALVAASVIAGCNTAPEIAILIPLKVGNSWTYRASDSVSAALSTIPVVPDSTLTSAVSSDTVVTGITWARIDSGRVLFGQPGKNFYWTNEVGGLAFRTLQNSGLLFLPYPAASGVAQTAAFGYVRATGNRTVTVPAG